MCVCLTNILLKLMAYLTHTLALFVLVMLKLKKKKRTLNEKIEGLMISNSFPSLGIPSYRWWEEATHGVSPKPVGNLTDGTNFPYPITTGCAFNRSLWRATGQSTIIRNGHFIFIWKNHNKKEPTAKHTHTHTHTHTHRPDFIYDDGRSTLSASSLMSIARNLHPLYGEVRL